MIVVDSSALIEVVAGQRLAQSCADVLLSSDNPLLISSATLTEVLIVACRKTIIEEMERFLDILDLSVEEVDEHFARCAAETYTRWGKGFHPARLNYGDCFSYALAEQYDCPLLYVGDDFAQTDIRSALGWR